MNDVRKVERIRTKAVWNPEMDRAIAEEAMRLKIAGFAEEAGCTVLWDTFRVRELRQEHVWPEQAPIGSKDHPLLVAHADAYRNA